MKTEYDQQKECELLNKLLQCQNLDDLSKFAEEILGPVTSLYYNSAEVPTYPTNTPVLNFSIGQSNYLDETRPIETKFEVLTSTLITKYLNIPLYCINEAPEQELVSDQLDTNTRDLINAFIGNDYSFIGLDIFIMNTPSINWPEFKHIY